MRFIVSFIIAFTAAVFIWIRGGSWDWPVLLRLMAPVIVFAAIAFLLLKSVPDSQWRNLGLSITLMF